MNERIEFAAYSEDTLFAVKLLSYFAAFCSIGLLLVTFVWEPLLLWLSASVFSAIIFVFLRRKENECMRETIVVSSTGIKWNYEGIEYTWNDIAELARPTSLRNLKRFNRIYLRTKSGAHRHIPAEDSNLLEMIEEIGSAYLPNQEGKL